MKSHDIDCVIKIQVLIKMKYGKYKNRILNEKYVDYNNSIYLPVNCKNWNIFEINILFSELIHL